MVAPGLNGFQLQRSATPPPGPPLQEPWVLPVFVRMNESNAALVRAVRNSFAMLLPPLLRAQTSNATVLPGETISGMAPVVLAVSKPGPTPNSNGAGLADTKAGATSAPSASASVSPIVAGTPDRAIPNHVRVCLVSMLTRRTVPGKPKLPRGSDAQCRVWVRVCLVPRLYPVHR